MRKKSVSGQPAKGKKSRTAKAAPRKSVGDLLFHSNLADILKDRERMAEDTALKAFPKEMQRLKKMGIQIPADSGVKPLDRGGALGAAEPPHGRDADGPSAHRSGHCRQDRQLGRRIGSDSPPIGGKIAGEVKERIFPRAVTPASACVCERFALIG